MNDDEQSVQSLQSRISTCEEPKQENLEKSGCQESAERWYASKRGSSSESWSSLALSESSSGTNGAEDQHGEEPRRSSSGNIDTREKERKVSSHPSNGNGDRNFEKDRKLSGDYHSRARVSPQSHHHSQDRMPRNLSFDDIYDVSESVSAFRSESDIPLPRMAQDSLTTSNHSRNLSFDASDVSDSVGAFRSESGTPRQRMAQSSLTSSSLADSADSDIENQLSVSVRTEISLSTKITDAIPVNEEEERERVRAQIEEAREEERKRSRNFVVAVETVGDKDEHQSCSNRNLCTFIAVIATAVLVAGAVFLFTDLASEPAQSPTPSPTFDSSLTNTPTAMSSEAPLHLEDPTVRRNILESLMSDYMPLNPSVVEWIAEVDTWKPQSERVASSEEWIDRYALVSIYQSTNGSDWTTNDGWLGPTSACQLQWHGVKCDGDSGLVTHLDLGYNGLGHTIPTEIGLLFSMKGIVLSGNRLTGELPNSFAALTALTSLLAKENFSLGGSIPSSLFSVSTLKRISLTDTIIEGTLPTEIGLLTALTALRLSRMRLTGPIPSEIGSLTKTKAFEVNGNSNLTGTIPTEVGLLTDLTNLLLRANDLTGEIPTEIGLMTSLTGFQFQETRLTGSLPSELGRATSLQKVGIDSTAVGSTIPTELGQLKGLREFTASSSNLSGSIPPEICDATSLTKLNLAKNPLLTGPIPTAIISCTNLNVLQLYNSGLTGDIPELPASIPNCRLDANCFSNVANGLARGCNVTKNC